MSTEKQPMFKALLEALKNQSDEDKAMFFADSESDLLAAYQEGKEARNKKIPITRNPYPSPKNNEIEKHSKYSCWGEGYADAFFFGDNKK